MEDSVTEKIGVSTLKGISIIYPNDIYDLACMLLKVNVAKDKGTNSRSRHTVHGVIRNYALLVNVDFDQIMTTISKYDLPLGATVERDEDIK